MLRCVVVDDEPLAVKLIESFISRTDFLETVGSWNDPVEALKMIQLIRPEVVFLDIQMPDLDGLELAGMIPEGTRVIFTTAFREYAFESYGVDALDFLLKPVRYQKFLEAALKAKQWFELQQKAALASSEGSPKDTSDSQNPFMFIKTDKGLIKLNLDNVTYIEGMKDYLLIHVSGQKTPLVTHLTMKAAAEMLNQNFMRVHRSFIVNLQKIDSVTSGNDIIVDGTFIHVSEAYAYDFNEYISKRVLSR